MKRLILPIVIVGCVVAAPVFAGPVKKKPVARKKAQEVWHRIYYEGKPMGYSHSSVTYEKHEGRKVRRMVEDAHVVFGVVACAVVQDNLGELDGRLISESFVAKFAGAPGADRLNETYTATVANGVLRVTATGPDVGKGMKKEIRLPEGLIIYGGVTERLLKRQGIGPGDVAEFHVFSSKTKKPEKRTVKKFERVKYVHEGKEIDAFRVTVEDAEDNDDTSMTMTTDYELLRIEIGSLVSVLSNKNDALANVPPLRPQIEILDD